MYQCQYFFNHQLNKQSELVTIALKKLVVALNDHCLLLGAHSNMLSKSFGNWLILFPESLFHSVTIQLVGTG